MVPAVTFRSELETARDKLKSSVSETVSSFLQYMVLIFGFAVLNQGQKCKEVGYVEQRAVCLQYWACCWSATSSPFCFDDLRTW